MDSRVTAVLDHIQSDPDFVCSPVKTALRKGSLLTSPSIDPYQSPSALEQQMQGIIYEFLSNSKLEGALLVSAADAHPEDHELGLLLPLSPIVRGIRTSVRHILPELFPYAKGGPGELAWEFILNGMGIGRISTDWCDQRWKDRLDDDAHEGIILTAHGPAYPSPSPRHQPHPTDIRT
jgi:hypothetical protein